MQEVLQYKNEKSDKFWRIETDGCDFVTNWGKTGTHGRYEIKTFDSEDSCEARAQALVRAKLKKGYVPFPTFDCADHYYFDTTEYGLHRLTSHPIFRRTCADDLFYDCVDEEAPFGSDEGHDALQILQDTLRKKPHYPVAEFPRALIADLWKLTFFPPSPLPDDATLQQMAAQTYNGLPGDAEILQSDQIIVAAAFGQLKITGNVSAALHAMAKDALTRTQQMYRLIWHTLECPYHIRIMQNALAHILPR